MRNRSKLSWQVQSRISKLYPPANEKPICSLETMNSYRLLYSELKSHELAVDTEIKGTFPLVICKCST